MLHTDVHTVHITMVTDSLLVLFISVIISRTLLRVITFYSLKHRLLSALSDRNTRRNSRLGGFAFFPSVAISIMIVCGYHFLFDKSNIISVEQILRPSIAAPILAALICFITGLFDDVTGVRYLKKFVSQFLCAILLVGGGLHIDSFHGLLGIYDIPPVCGIYLSVIFIVFVINAINMIDGIDGLCAGICSFALLYYGCIFISGRYYFYALFSFAMLGTIIPFVIYNIRGVKNKIIIFMGDTGSISLGLMLSILCLSLYLKLPVIDGQTLGNPLALAGAPLILPIFDAIRVSIHRLRLHRNPFKADMNHIHHKLLRVGLTQSQTLLTLLIISLFFTITNLLLSNENINLILGLEVLLYTALNIGLNRKIKKSRTKTKNQ